MPPRPPPRTVCKYEPGCYQRSEDHLRRYSHPSRDDPPPPPKPARPRGTSPRATHHGHPTLTDILVRKGKDAGTPSPIAATLLDPPLRPLEDGEKPAKRARVESEVGAVATGGPKQTPLTASVPTPASPKKEVAAEAERDDKELLLPPPPRHSPLSGAVDAVYEIPFGKDFHVVVEVAKALLPADPAHAFHGFRLVGPFFVAFGGSFSSDAEKWRRWRHRYDPPEVMTVLVSTSRVTGAGDFIAYHRDHPAELPGLVVRGRSDSARFSVVSDNLVSALLECLPASSPGRDLLLKQMPTADSEKHATKSVLRARTAATVAKTISGLGVKVPFNKKQDLGYRDPMFSTAHFMGLVAASASGVMTPKQQEELFDQYRFADIANDEGDFGLSLELGLNMFTAVRRRNCVSDNTFRILDTVYMLLDRDLYRHILRCHYPLLVGEEEPQLA